MGHGRNLAGLLAGTFGALALASCRSDTAQPANPESTPSSAVVTARGDPHSAARPEEVAVQHMDLELAVDFAARRIQGTVALHLRRASRADELTLDTRDLEIHAVTAGPGRETVEYSLGDADPILGQALTIELPRGCELVHVEYSTSPEAAAVQWLEPQQTAGKRHPFLFTQSQAILARTWVPCQDTPSVRFTYAARVTVPPGLLALMSAENPTEASPSGIHEFHMRQPIPSYLLALAVGDLAFRSLGPRSGVYAEPSVVDRAAYEFADTESMIAAAEKLYGPYRWGRYDLLVLPPSFPFGGMENPRLTFATPTVLAGDRSLVALIAHELAHSWSGNLVTNANWNDFWLNEGFTVYLEHRIMEEVYGRDYEEMLAVLALQSLRDEIAGLPDRDTWLHLDLEGRDPDDGMTEVAYEKGYFFLRMLEESLGRERWDGILRRYFEDFAFRTMTSEGFVSRLENELEPGESADLALDSWIYGPGLPANCPAVSSTNLQRVESTAAAFLDGTPASELDVRGWTTHHWLYFLQQLPEPLGPARMDQLDAAFDFTGSGNSEILEAWLLEVIASNYAKGNESLESFLTRQGRRKFLKPLYQKLAETPEGLARARRIYERARPGYHSVSRTTIDEILGWPWTSG